MKRLVIALVLLGVAGTLTWYLLQGVTWTLKFTQQQLEEQVAKRFPKHKTFLVIGLHYENPRVRLTDGSKDIGVGVDVRVDAAGQGLKGSADLLTKIAYDKETATLLFNEARLVDLKVEGLGKEVAEQVKSAASLLAGESLSGIPVYTLKSTDVKAALVRLVIKSVFVRDGLLHVEVGL
jgi:hypothetical protein